MAASKFINVRVVGVEKILRKLNRADPVLAKPWTSALKEAVTLVQHDMKDDAPGDLGARITTRLHARPVPLYGKVGLLPMPSRKGFRYPGALHGAANRYHYRSGPKMGQNTHGWLTRSLDHLQGKINGLLGKAANAIKTEWDR
jgi:hypothetical protein